MCIAKLVFAKLLVSKQSERARERETETERAIVCSNQFLFENVLFNRNFVKGYTC